MSSSMEIEMESLREDGVQESHNQASDSSQEHNSANGQTYIGVYVPLHRAALQGNWEAAKNLEQNDDTLVRARITENRDTALHIAAAEGHIHFVKELLGKVRENDLRGLKMKNTMQKTALCFAAYAGHVDIAKLMLEKDLNLIRVDGHSSLYYSAWLGHKEMATYLFKMSVETMAEGAANSVFHSWSVEQQIKILLKCIHSGLYDLAVDIINQKPSLAVEKDGEDTPLSTLAKKPHTMNLKVGRNICPALKLLNRVWDKVGDQFRREVESQPALGDQIKQMVFAAAESKNEDFVVELIRKCPDLIYKSNDKGRSIFHIAVLNRSEKIFNLNYELHGIKDLMMSFIDDEGNNILHLAAKLPPPNLLNTIPGAALQMKMEVLWYKNVEKMVPKEYITMKNALIEPDGSMKHNAGLTPKELFWKEHHALRKEGEEQIKQSAKACMLLATVIVTVVFTTAFTVPGDYNDKGRPNLQNEKMFMILPVSQAIATLASFISILMFLSLLCSRYLEDDFRWRLLFLLGVGVAALFVSFAAMMAAFCRCLFFFDLGLPVKIILLVAFLSSVLLPILFELLRLLVTTCKSPRLFKSNNLLFFVES